MLYMPTPTLEHDPTIVDAPKNKNTRIFKGANNCHYRKLRLDGYVEWTQETNEIISTRRLGQHVSRVDFPADLLDNQLTTSNLILDPQVSSLHVLDLAHDGSRWPSQT